MSTEKHPQPSQSQAIEFNLINLDPDSSGFPKQSFESTKYVLRTILNSFLQVCRTKTLVNQGLGHASKKEELFLLRNNYNLRLEDFFFSH